MNCKQITVISLYTTLTRYCITYFSDYRQLLSFADLHYYAPELRRLMKAMHKGSIPVTIKKLQAADMYAFGMVLYEIVFRKKSVAIDESSSGKYFVNS